MYLWNMTTDKRVYASTDEQELIAFAKFWGCTLNKYELACYIN